MAYEQCVLTGVLAVTLTAGGKSIGALAPPQRCVEAPAVAGLVARSVDPSKAMSGVSTCASNGASGSEAPAALSSAACSSARYAASDRDAGQVVLLDHDLIEVGRIGVPYALELEPSADGRIWVVSASALGPLGPHELRRMDLLGQVDVRVGVGPLFDLASCDGQAALLVVGRSDGQREALEVAPSGAVRPLSVGASLSCVAGAGARAVVAGHDGWIRSYDLTSAGTPPLERLVGGVIADVAPGPVRGGFYVLDVAGGPTQRRLSLVSADLSTLWTRSLGCGALHLSVSPDRQRVWVADGAAQMARRFGAGGALELAFAALPLPGVERGVASADGGVIFAAPGALVRLGATGAALPGQGGFDFLVDVAELRAR